MFSGSPISVAVPPMFEGDLHDGRAGRAIRARRHHERDGTPSRIVVSFQERREHRRRGRQREREHDERRRGFDGSPRCRRRRSLDHLAHDHHPGERTRARSQSNAAISLLLADGPRQQDGDHRRQRDLRAVDPLAGDHTERDHERRDGEGHALALLREEALGHGAEELRPRDHADQPPVARDGHEQHPGAAGRSRRLPRRRSPARRDVLRVHVPADGLRAALVALLERVVERLRRRTRRARARAGSRGRQRCRNSRSPKIPTSRSTSVEHRPAGSSEASSTSVAAATVSVVAQRSGASRSSGSLTCAGSWRFLIGTGWRCRRWRSASTRSVTGSPIPGTSTNPIGRPDAPPSGRGDVARGGDERRVAAEAGGERERPPVRRPRRRELLDDRDHRRREGDVVDDARADADTQRSRAAPPCGRRP